MEFQRFTAPDPAALEAGILEMQTKLSEAIRVGAPPADIVDHAGDLGSMLTTARHEAEALHILDAHRALAETLSTQEVAGWFLNAHATALQYMGRREEANTVFAHALALCRAGGWQRLQSFVLHHWGRSLVEQGRWDDAEQYFSEALAIRQQLDDPRQASTQRALEGLAQLKQQTRRASS